MRKMHFELVGVAPLMINGYVPETKSGKKSEAEYRAIAIQKLHKDERGFCCVTSEMLKACALAGASLANVKEGKRSMVQYLKAALLFESPNISLGKKEPDNIDVRMGRIPPGPRGQMVALYRPVFNEGWKLSFTVQVTLDTLDLGRIRDSFVAGGVIAGIGAHRPEFGRFEVVEPKGVTSGK